MANFLFFAQIVLSFAFFKVDGGAKVVAAMLFLILFILNSLREGNLVKMVEAFIDGIQTLHEKWNKPRWFTASYLLFVTFIIEAFLAAIPIGIGWLVSLLIKF